MKKIFAILTACAFLGFSAVAFAGIQGSKHDLTPSGAGGYSATELCGNCHTPHNSDTTVADAPLWSHVLTTATFTPYSSSTLDATIDFVDSAPTGISKLCMSCHDGVTALYEGGPVINDNSARVGIDLSNDHPVSFTYDTNLATTLDGELHDPATAVSGLGGTIAADMLFSGQMECGSCHDVHDNDTFQPFLRKSNAGSALCMTCHDK